MCSPEVIANVRAQFRRRSRAVDRRHFIGGAGAMAAAGALGPLRGFAQGATPSAAQATPIRSGSSISIGTIVDLTHTMTPDTPVFPGNVSFKMDPITTIEADGFYKNLLTYDEHTGTHMDSPAHFTPGDALTADLLAPENFIVPLVVIDISDKASSDDDAALTADDIAVWEGEYGEIPTGSFVAMYSGWDARIDDAASFVNLDAEGVQHYPGLDPDAMDFLLTQRTVVGAGVDTLSLDIGASTDFASHVTLLGSGRYGLEALNQLGTIPPVGATIIVGGPKHLNASGGPSRVFAVF